MAEKPNILIAVPAYGGSIKRLCAQALVYICLRLQREGIAFDFGTLDSGSIIDTRNALATASLQSGHTHLLMIDNDMVPTEGGIVQMMRADKPVIGWASPIRPNSITNPPLRFNIGPKQTVLDFDERSGICRVEQIGAGVMLVQTTVFRRLIETNKLRPQRGHDFKNVNGPIYGFFDRIDDAGVLLPEDFSFCRRWRSLCGGEIFALAGLPIGHIGEGARYAKLSDHIKVGETV